MRGDNQASVNKKYVFPNKISCLPKMIAPCKMKMTKLRDDWSAVNIIYHKNLLQSLWTDRNYS